MRRTLHAATAVRAGSRGRVAVAVVLRWDEDGGLQDTSCRPRAIVRRLRRGDPMPAAYRALLLALWEARRMRARAIVLNTEDIEVAAHLTGAAPPPETLGPYLQVRAMLNAFRSAEVKWRTASDDPDTAAAAAGAASALGEPAAVCTDLPLWSAAAAT